MSSCVGLGLTFHTIEIKIKYKKSRNLLLFYESTVYIFNNIPHFLNRAVYMFLPLFTPGINMKQCTRLIFSIKMKSGLIMNFFVLNFLRVFYIVLRADGLIQVEICCNLSLKQLTALTINKSGAKFVMPTFLLHRYLARRSSYSLIIVILFHLFFKQELLVS